MSRGNHDNGGGLQGEAFLAGGFLCRGLKCSEDIWSKILPYSILVRRGGTLQVARGCGILPEGTNPGCTVASWCLAFAMHLVGIAAEGRTFTMVEARSRMWQSSSCGYWSRPFSGCLVAPEARKVYSFSKHVGPNGSNFGSHLCQNRATFKRRSNFCL